MSDTMTVEKTDGKKLGLMSPDDFRILKPSDKYRGVAEVMVNDSQITFTVPSAIRDELVKQLNEDGAPSLAAAMRHFVYQFVGGLDEDIIYSEEEHDEQKPFIAYFSAKEINENDGHGNQREAI